MINDDFQQTNSGESAGYQARRDINITGVSYTEARQIALDLWRASAIELSQQAAQIALARVDKFLDAFLAKLNEKDPALFERLKDPGVQMALFAAQRDYAKTGDEDVFGLLVEVLAKRIEQTERTTLQVVLDESLMVISRLTQEHIDLLTDVTRGIAW